MNTPDWLRRLNHLGDAVSGAHHLVSVNWTELKEIARRSTGCDDFGDEQYTPHYLDVVKDPQDLSLLQLLVLKKTILMGLRNRLLLMDRLRKCPAILSETIEQPLIITGLQRTGTSILFELLAKDATLRAPIGAEAQFPTLSKLDSTTFAAHQRLAECEFELMTDACPELLRMHECRHDLPVDCSWIMKSVLGADTSNAYGWHKRILQTLQYERPQRSWLLKCVSHLNNLAALFACYPNARVIITHRDPTNSIVSGIRILREAASFLLLSPKVGTVEHSYDYMSAQESALRKLIDQRQVRVIPEDHVADIHFRDLMDDPVTAIRATYEKLGLTFGEDFARRIAQYLKMKPRYAFGENKYTAEDVGLTKQEIRGRFSFYINHYRIAHD